MRTVLIAAALAATIIGIGQAHACNVAVPGCQQSITPLAPRCRDKSFARWPRQSPPAPMPTPSMSFGAINGHAYSVQRFGNWTNIEVGQ
jgi:hypothetical protein